jgi:uncharacterized protein YegP (UPF0339 family)
MKLLRTLALSGVLAASAAGVVSLAPETAFGQAAKTPAPGAKGTTPAKPTAAEGKVLITKDKQGKFRFQIRDGEDKTLAQSVKGYETVKEATETLEAVKALLNSKKIEEEK